MYRHILILPDGTELFSGPEQKNALRSVTVTQCINSGEELTLGSACACELRAELITPHGGLSLAAGDVVTLFEVDEANNRRQTGVFWLEKPVCSTTHTMELIAYDSINQLDKNLTNWLAQLDQWPYSVQEFAQLVCNQCGVTLAEEELPNGSFYLQPFAGEKINGRRLIQWLGQITGRFCRARVYPKCCHLYRRGSGRKPGLLLPGRAGICRLHGGSGRKNPAAANGFGCGYGLAR